MVSVLPEGVIVWSNVKTGCAKCVKYKVRQSAAVFAKVNSHPHGNVNERIQYMDAILHDLWRLLTPSVHRICILIL